jgi:integrase/recombinase XerD
VLSIPTKRAERREVRHLNDQEVDVLLAAPDPGTWTGRRDHVLLDLAVQTGLRVSEVTGLRIGDLKLGTGAHVRCRGKGRKERCTPLAKETVRLLRTWLKERGGVSDEPLFPTRRGTPLTRSAVGCLVAKHATTAAARCPSLLAKHTTPHVLRHTCAMSLLRAGCDTSVIALWLGHENMETTARIYLHGDLSIKERALDRTLPLGVKPGRYRPADPLLAFLAAL